MRGLGALALAAIVVAAPAAAQPAGDRHEGYYYPKVTGAVTCF